MITVSHSELACFRDCPRKHHYRYRLRREPRAVAEALQVGKRVDLALRGDAVDLKPQERAMVAGHDVWWKNQSLEAIQNAVWFTARIADEISITGELDAVAIIDGKEVIIERKTTSQDIGPGSQYWRKVIHVDPQVSLYLIAKPTAAYVLYDVLRKPALRGKAGETDDELYSRTLEAILKEPEKYYQRASIVRFEHERAAHVRDVEGTVHLMQNCPHEPPRNVDSCFKFGRECEFFAVCANEREITDDSAFMDRPARSVKAESSANRSLQLPGAGQVDAGQQAPEARDSRLGRWPCFD